MTIDTWPEVAALVIVQLLGAVLIGELVHRMRR